MSLDCKRTFLARSISACPDTFVTAAIYLMMILEAPVFPEPDSPEITMQVSLPDLS